MQHAAAAAPAIPLSQSTPKNFRSTLWPSMNRQERPGPQIGDGRSVTQRQSVSTSTPSAWCTCTRRAASVQDLEDTPVRNGMHIDAHASLLLDIWFCGLLYRNPRTATRVGLMAPFHLVQSRFFCYSVHLSGMPTPLVLRRLNTASLGGTPPCSHRCMARRIYCAHT